DQQALEDASGTGSIAAAWYSPTSFTININITDGQTHQLALYLLDWPNQGRSEQVQIIDAATGTVLSTQTASNFQKGEYLVWNVSGDIEIQITDLSGPNAVVSGLFFDPVTPPPAPPSPGAASFLYTDTATEGSWQGVYGSQGYNVIDNASNYPSYAQVSASGNSIWTWSRSTTDPRALQDASGTGSIAAAWYSPTSFTINVDITDGQTHQLALYLLDWDNQGVSEQIQILDAATGTVLSTQTASNFANGKYLVWNISGDVEIRFTDLSGPSADLSGLFFDPVASPPPASPGAATFLYTDTTTQGSWQGVYGGQGYNVIDNASSYPNGVQVSASGNSSWIWNSSTTDPRALEDANGSGRIAAAWYSPTSFTINVNITNGNTYQLALYLLDYDNQGVSEQIQILDAATGNVLSTQTASNFSNGEYLVWNVSGDVEIRFTDLTGPSADLSGLFFDPVASPPPPASP
ncbi:MAG TPA: hypothetical protein VMF69_23880, partial [Gemmataceae bacterium]|nr:hypothetical protein [Gemmataceae bacterium]